MIEKFRKKPIVIEALQWTGKNYEEVQNFTSGKVSLTKFDYLSPLGEMVSDKKLLIDTLEGNLFVGIGDYIIKGVKGEFYPCKELIFWETYDRV